jgi:riboflavin-specific deaminase-like protein
MASDLPFTLLNLAMTADGKIATLNRQVSSFSSPRDKQHMMELRATVDAVMSGARTVDLNAVTLGPGSAKYRKLRIKRGMAEYNVRVIASGAGSIDPKAEIFKKRFSPIIILTTTRAGQRRLSLLQELADEVKVCGETELDFGSALRWLRKKWNVRRLLCEGGGELDDALFRAGVVKELHLTICPKIIGGRDAPTIADGTGFGSLARAYRLKLKSFKRRGEELFLVYRVR